MGRRRRRHRPICNGYRGARGARGGAGAALGPGPGERALLADSGFILKPDLKRLGLRRFRQGRLYRGGEVFLNASCAAGSDFGRWGRTERRRNPSAASCLPTVRSCMSTPKRSSILRFRSMRRQRNHPVNGMTRPLSHHLRLLIWAQQRFRTRRLAVCQTLEPPGL